jgi:hypothetical protein
MPNTIAENLQRLVDAKDDIAEAITAKGGTVSSGDGLEEFAADIATIPSGSSADAESYLMAMSSGFKNTSYAYIVNATNETFVYGVLNANALKTTSTLTMTYPSVFTPVATTFSSGYLEFNKDNAVQQVLTSSYGTYTIDTTNHTVTIAFKTNNYFKTGDNLLCMKFKTKA